MHLIVFAAGFKSKLSVPQDGTSSTAGRNLVRKLHPVKPHNRLLCKGGQHSEACPFGNSFDMFISMSNSVMSVSSVSNHFKEVEEAVRVDAEVVAVRPVHVVTSEMMVWLSDWLVGLMILFKLFLRDKFTFCGMTRVARWLTR